MEILITMTILAIGLLGTAVLTAGVLKGGSSNVTGSILAGSDAMGDTDVLGGSIKIIYCSTAVQAQTENLPLRILSWRKVD